MSQSVVLVTGASGLVGTWLLKTAPEEVAVVAGTHRREVRGATSINADLRDLDAVLAAFGATRPSLVIHAAVALDAASIVQATANVVRAASTVGADVVHLSTDAVFAGDGRPVAEDAVPDPISTYGRWKAEAERLVLDQAPRSAAIRLPLVVSLEPEDSAVAKIRHGAVERSATAWFQDETRQPAMAADLAPAIWRIARLGAERRAGVWHLPGPERLSRYEIAQRIVAALRLDPASIRPETSPPAGERPRHLNMLDGRARSDLGWDPTPILRPRG